MATSTKPTVVLIPGAWHSPEAFNDLAVLLEETGYPVDSVALPSVGASPSLPDFGPDVAAVRSVVGHLVEAGKEVLVVMHSYGGVVGTEALQGLSKQERGAEGVSGGVTRLIYIAALVPRIGETAMEISRASDNENLTGLPSRLQRLDNGDGTISVADAPLRFYGDLPPEDASKLENQLKPQSVGPFLSRVTYEAYRKIPAAYLLTAKDNAIHIDIQRRMVRETGIDVVDTVETSHSPFLSQPKLVAQFIRRLAGEVL